MRKAIIASLVPKIQGGIELSKMKINLARKKMIIALVLSMILRRSVRFTELAEVLNDEVQEASNLRRIQSFIAEYDLSYVQFALLLSCYLPKGDWTICLDRTNWKFGKRYFNILALTVYSKGVGIPLLFEFLENKGGNSNEKQRIELLKKFIKIFGTSKIKTLIGDREFIGSKWFNWLTVKKISFYIRIKKSAIVGFESGEELPIKELVYPRRARLLKNVNVYGNKLNIAIKRTKKRNAKGEIEILAIATNSNVENALKVYQKRWSIEVFFQSIKSRGFNLEKTHLDDPIRLKKVVVLASLAFAISFRAGVWKNKNIKPIKIKNHGYRAKSYFRYGLDYIRSFFKIFSETKDEFFNFLKILIPQKSFNNESMSYNYRNALRK